MEVRPLTASPASVRDIARRGVQALRCGNVARYINGSRNREKARERVNCEAFPAWDPEQCLPFMVIRATRAIAPGEEVPARTHACLPALSVRSLTHGAHEHRMHAPQIIIDYGDNFWRVIMRHTLRQHEMYCERVRSAGPALLHRAAAAISARARARAGRERERRPR